MDLNNFKSSIISNNDLFRVMRENFPIDVCSYGDAANERVSIFKDHLDFFEALIQLETFIENQGLTSGEEGGGNVETHDQIHTLFESLAVYELINDKLTHVSFIPCLTFKQSLIKWKNRYPYLDLLDNINKIITWSDSLIKRCECFLIIYSQELHERNSRRKMQKGSDIAVNYKELYELFFYHGKLFTVCLKFNVKREDLNNLEFQTLETIVQLLTSDVDLIWARFKYEDDGKFGVNLVCTLIYPFEAKKSFSRQVDELIALPRILNLNSILTVSDWGVSLKSFSNKEVTGKVDTYEKLESFIYWVVSPLYRYEEFFNYPNCENPLQILDFKRDWDRELSLAIRHSKGFKLTFEKMGNYSKNREIVWSTKSLNKTVQSKLIQAKKFYAELVSNSYFEGKIDTDTLYYIEVFNEFLMVSQELFFLFDASIFSKEKVRLSRIGNQLLFIFKHMLKDPNAFINISYVNRILGNRWDSLLDSEIWKTLTRLHQEGISSILNFQALDLLNYQYQKSIFKENIHFGAKHASYEIGDAPVLHTISELVFFEKRTIETQKYVKALLQKDQFVCRFQFTMQIDDSSFLSNKRFFSECFTEFRRVSERKKWLKNLSGYFMIWLKDKDGKPVADVIWILDSTPDFEYMRFLKSLQNGWLDFLVAFFSLKKDQYTTQHFSVVPKDLMYSNELLKKPYTLVEGTDSVLKKQVIDQLVPYFTYRHFFLPKFYDDPKMRTKLFTKGKLTQPNKTRKDRLSKKT